MSSSLTEMKVKMVSSAGAQIFGGVQVSLRPTAGTPVIRGCPIIAGSQVGRLDRTNDRYRQMSENTDGHPPAPHSLFQLAIP
jgi:hypothetical protein